MGWVDTAAGPGRPGLATIQVLAPAGPFPALFENPDSPFAPWLSVSILMLLAGAAIAGSLLRRTGVAEESVGIGDTARLGFGLLPFVCLSLVALAGLPVYFAGRTESMVWALVVAMVSILLWQLPAPARWTAVSIYTLVGGLTIALWLVSMPERPPAHGVAVGRALSEVIQGGDRLFTVGLWQLEVQHGLAEAGLELENDEPVPTRVETLPRSQADHPGWFDRDAPFSPQMMLDLEDLRKRAYQDGSRIWLVWSPDLPFERSLASVFAEWQNIKMADDVVIRVDLLVPPIPVERAPGSDQHPIL